MLHPGGNFLRGPASGQEADIPEIGSDPVLIRKVTGVPSMSNITVVAFITQLKQKRMSPFFARSSFPFFVAYRTLQAVGV